MYSLNISTEIYCVWRMVKKDTHACCAHMTWCPSSLANPRSSYTFCFFLWDVFPDKSGDTGTAFMYLTVLTEMFFVWLFYLPESLTKQWTFSLSLIFVSLVYCSALHELINLVTKLRYWFFWREYTEFQSEYCFTRTNSSLGKGHIYKKDNSHKTLKCEVDETTMNIISYMNVSSYNKHQNSSILLLEM